MKKTVWKAGRSCFIQAGDDAIVSLKCVTCDHAEGLQIDIEHCVSIDIDHPVISNEAQKKIDALREQIAQADEVNDKLREDKSLLLAQNKALIESLYAMWQVKEQEIMDNEDIVTERDKAIVILHGKIGNLKGGIKELSDRFQESQHQEIKRRKERDRALDELRGVTGENNLAAKIYEAKIVEKERQIKNRDNQIGQLLGRKAVNADQIDEEIDENKEDK